MANNLLGRVDNYGYEYGGEVRGYQGGGKIARAMKISKARKDIRRRARKMKKKGRLANIGSIVGEIIGKGVKYIPGVGATVGKILSPIVSGVLAKYGAELGYGKRVGAGEGKWLPGYRDILREFETGTRGGFQERGYGAAIRGAGQELGKYGLEKFGATDFGKAASEWKAGVEEKYGFGQGVQKPGVSPYQGLGAKSDVPLPTGAIESTGDISEAFFEMHGDDPSKIFTDPTGARVTAPGAFGEFVRESRGFSPFSLGGGGYASRYQEGGEVPLSWGQRFVERFPSRHEDPERAVGQQRGLSSLIDFLVPQSTAEAGLMLAAGPIFGKAGKFLKGAKGIRGGSRKMAEGMKGSMKYPELTMSDAPKDMIVELKKLGFKDNQIREMPAEIAVPFLKKRRLGKEWKYDYDKQQWVDLKTGKPDKFQQGGYAGNSLLYRVFGNKSNLF